MAIIMTILVGLYFYLFSSVIEEQVQSTFESLVNNMESSLLENINNIEKDAKRYVYSNDVQDIIFFKEPEEYFRAATATEDLTNFIMNENPNINAIFICQQNGRSFCTDTSKRQLFTLALEKYWPKGDYNFQKPFFSTLFYNNGESSSPYVIYFYPFYNIRSGEFERENNSICAILCNVDYLINWLNIDNSHKSIMAIIHENRIISSNRFLNESENIILCNSKDGRGTINMNHNKYLTNSITLPQLSWEFVYAVPKNEILRDIIQIRNISFILLFCVVSLLFAIMMFIITLITRPVKQIIYDMRDVQNQKRSHIQGTKVLELQELADGINQTLDSIEYAHSKEREAQYKLYQAIIEQNYALLYAYQNQINPHFLFNTLECMRSMARHYHVEPLEKLVSSLAPMFRYSLRSNIVVSLSEEIEHVKNYINIMQQRTQNNCKLRILIPAEAITHPILAISLQPIVENSITHAFKEEKNLCIIQIQGKIIHESGIDMLIVRITDNGCGISEKELVTLQTSLQGKYNIEKTSSIGLSNIAKRLKLVFGEYSELTIKSREGYFTSVELKIPEKPKKIPQNNRIC